MLGLLAVAGVALSVAFLLVSTDLGRGLLVPRLVRAADDALAGSIELQGFHLLAKGGIELVGLRVVDPDGDAVLTAERARVYLDVARLRSRAVGLVVELESPTVVLRREEDGTLSVARAFAPARPQPRRADGGQPLAWTVRLTRVTVRDGRVRYVDASGADALAAEGLTLDGRAVFAPARAGVEVKLRGQLTAPERAPLALDARVGVRGSSVRASLLRAVVGDTALELAGEADWKSWRGRAAVLSLAVDAEAVRELVPRSPLAGDVTGTVYAESNGSQATAALELAPRVGGGSARAAAALRLPPGSLMAAADLDVASLDLSRLLRAVPKTDVTGSARLRAAGRDLEALRGAASLQLAPSRLRGGRLGPVEARLTADRGRFELTRLEASLPGGSLSAKGRWRRGGELAATATADASDLRALLANLRTLLDRPLPEASGALRLEVAASGTEAAPALELRASAPRLALPGVEVGGLALRGRLAGTRADPRAELTGTAARLAAGGRDAQGVELGARVASRAAEVSLRGQVPGLGPDPLLVEGRGALQPGGEVVVVDALTLAWPGDRFALVAPARVRLDGPSVDRLELAGGAQRLAVVGGVSGTGRRRTVDARVEVEALELVRLPRALLPPRLGLAGRVGGEVRATGAASAPEVTARASLADGAVAGVTGLTATAEGAFLGPQRRVRLDLAARRAGGGELRARGELPVALGRAPPREPLSLEVRAIGVPIADALALARASPAEPVAGLARAELRLGGTAGAPTLHGSAALEGGRYGDVEALALALDLADPGEEATLRATLDTSAGRAAEAEVALRFALAAALREPATVARAIANAPLRAGLRVPGLDLAAFAGRQGLPEELAGRLTGEVALTGTARAPRGTARAALAGGALAGYREVGATADLTLAPDALALTGQGGLSGQEMVRWTGRWAVPPERLADAAVREAAPLELVLEVPRADLRRAAAPVPLAGELAGRVEAKGSLAAPRLVATFQGKRLEVGGQPLGELTGSARADDRAVHAELLLAAAGGGTLSGALDAQAGIGLAALRSGALRRAPARAKLVANALDLGFLPAVAPGVVRSASGKLGLDLFATGPLEALAPRGTAALANGKVAVAEYGEWTGVGLTASLTEDAFRVDRLVARGRTGTVEIKAEAKGLARGDAPADVTASLRADDLSLPRAGENLATLTVDATFQGTLRQHRLEGELRVPSGLVRLPDKLGGRTIQRLDKREDIDVGPFRRPRPAPPLAAQAVAAAASRPYTGKVHVLAPNRFWVKGESPRVDVELKADVTVEAEGGELYFTGVAETLRGQVEPIGGRVFDLKRARVQFSGDAYQEGVLEVSALYTNPAAVVTVGVSGTIREPEVKLTSQPPLDEGQIALLIATGRTELKAGTGGVNDSVLSQAGNAALGALSQQFARELVGKLPVDSVSVDATQLRAGKYLGPKVYVGYTYRFQAQPQQGENTNEVRLEYQISPRWNFEARAGDAGTGAGSLIWSKDY